MPHRVVAVVLLAVAALALGGCSSGSSTGSMGSNGSAGGGSVTIPITFRHGQVTPHDGHRVEVSTGEPVHLVVTADSDEEIHVHSDPEHEYHVHPGRHQVFTFSVGTPGIVPIESHTLDVTIVQLEVR